MKRYFTYLFVVLAGQIFAQVNLVPNPSFEEREYCPNGNIDKAAGWFSPTYGSPDIFQNWSSGGTCYENCDWVGVFPYTGQGVFQSPRTGVAFVGMVTLGSWSGGAREYISIQLNDTLEAGKKYCVSFYTCISGYSALAYDKVGVYFSVLSPLDCAPNQIISNNGIINEAGDVILDTLNWVLVSDTFVATGGERFLTLGNFQNHSDLQIDSTGFQGPWWCYQLFDDISVVYCDTIIEPPPPPPVYSEFTLFPNPSNGEFSITGNFPSGTQLSIYNMLGQKIGESIVLPEGNNIIPIDLELAQGMYYYALRSPIEQVAEGKLIIAD